MERGGVFGGFNLVWEEVKRKQWEGIHGFLKGTGQEINSIPFHCCFPFTSSYNLSKYLYIKTLCVSYGFVKGKTIK